MPLIEYECQQCHRRLEKIQKFSDAPLTVCPQCGGELQQTITAPAIQFKGAGWYKDLYSSAKPPAAAGSGEGATPAAGSGDSAASAPAAGGDSKPAAPAPSTPAPAASGAPSGS